jgi:hypothetical protein
MNRRSPLSRRAGSAGAALEALQAEVVPNLPSTDSDSGPEEAS